MNDLKGAAKKAYEEQLIKERENSQELTKSLYKKFLDIFKPIFPEIKILTDDYFLFKIEEYEFYGRYNKDDFYLTPKDKSYDYLKIRNLADFGKFLSYVETIEGNRKKYEEKKSWYKKMLSFCIFGHE